MAPLWSESDRWDQRQVCGPTTTPLAPGPTSPTIPLAPEIQTATPAGATPGNMPAEPVRMRLEISALLGGGGGLGDHGAPDRADTLDLDAHALTGAQQPSGEHADAAGRPGGDEVAGLQRADAGQRRDHIADPGDHLLRGAVLAQLAVDPRTDTETRRIHLVGGDEPRPYGSMGVKALGRPHGWSVLLPVTYRHVIAHRVAGNGGKRRGGIDSTTPLRDHRHEFSLVVQHG